ncbi:hypothetical protein EVAR_103063_1 [Eumeta japonica]|uniref:Uncharacterized protein n=1 Tax=Eumeta variegata TaxID=151549 RepID=A0A4C1WMK3_EUMVA|nr:hypothetical protein EVAR_103063_1 [Eumeta japonica]
MTASAARRPAPRARARPRRHKTRTGGRARRAGTHCALNTKTAEKNYSPDTYLGESRSKQLSGHNSGPEHDSEKNEGKRLYVPDAGCFPRPLIESGENALLADTRRAARLPPRRPIPAPQNGVCVNFTLLQSGNQWRVTLCAIAMIYIGLRNSRIRENSYRKILLIS